MTNVQLPSISGAVAAGKVQLDTMRSSSAVASSVMGKISGRVAGKISRALQLVDEENEERQHGGQQGDPYAIDELVDALAKELPGNPVALGLVSRSLHEFAHEVAALVMARPQSTSIAYLERLVAEQDNSFGEANLLDLATIITRTTSKLQGT